MVFIPESSNPSILSMLKKNVGSHIRDPTTDETAQLEYLKINEEETYKTLIVPVISSILFQIITQNDLKIQSNLNSNRSLFDSKVGAPSISIEAYLERVIQHTRCSPECFIVCLIYLDRLIGATGLLITSLNVHRFLITSIMLASKLYDDVIYNNRHFSLVGGIEVTELNLLELSFLNILEFRLTVDSEIFQKYKTLVEKLYAFAHPEKETVSPNYEAIATSPVFTRKKAFQVFGALRRSKSCVSIGFSKPKALRNKDPSTSTAPLPEIDTSY